VAFFHSLMLRYFYLLCTALVCLLLPSCLLEGEEHIYINADGSAKMSAVYKVSTRAMSADAFHEVVKDVDKALSPFSDVDLVKNDYSVEAGMHVYRLEFSVGSAETVHTIYHLHFNGHGVGGGGGERAAPSILEMVIGAFDFAVEDRKRVRIDRSVDLGPLVKPKLKGNNKLLGNSRFKYHLHLPVPVKSSNAHAMSEDRRSLSWDFRVQDYVESPMKLVVHADIPKADGYEKLELNADGSGYIQADYHIPLARLTKDEAELLQHELIPVLGKYPGVRLTQFDLKETGIFLNVNAVVTFDSVRDLIKLFESGDLSTGGAKESEVSIMAGDVSVDLAGLSVRLNRTISVNKLVRRCLDNHEELIGETQLHYAIVLPKAAKSTNAHRVLEDGRRLEWSFIVLDQLDDPIEIQLTAPIPIPAWVWVTVILVVIVVGLLGRKLVKRRSEPKGFSQQR